MDIKVEITRSDSETELFGERLAKESKPGDVIAIVGDLGAGKTTMIRGLCRQLGVDDSFSPTFIIVNQYDAENLTINHIDMYRIESHEEFIERGIEEYLFQSDALTIVEWADRFPEFFSDEEITYIKIKSIDINSREIQIGKGTWEEMHS